jgi:hypothetical protein
MKKQWFKGAHVAPSSVVEMNQIILFAPLEAYSKRSKNMTYCY